MENNNRDRDFLFSSTFKAGRRTYFFDVKKTKTNDYFLTITESKKFTDNETGDVNFEKHRIFLYEEDFSKFMEALSSSLDFVKQKGENDEN